MKSSSESRADWLAPLGTVLAILACYGTLAIVGVLSLMGISIAVNEGIWAGAIGVFALLALAGIVLGWRGHRAVHPLLLGIVGTSLVLWTMGVSYNRPTEIAGFIILALAAALDWRAKRNRHRGKNSNCSSERFSI